MRRVSAGRMSENALTLQVKVQNHSGCKVVSAGSDCQYGNYIGTYVYIAVKLDVCAESLWAEVNARYAIMFCVVCSVLFLCKTLILHCIFFQ